MKTTLLYAAMLISPAIFAQDATVKTSQSAEVKTSVKAGEQTSAGANASASSSSAIHATGSAVNAAGEKAMDVKAETTAKVKKAKAKASAETQEAVNTTTRNASNTSVSADLASSAGISAGKDNKLNAATSLDNAATISAHPAKTVVNAGNTAAVQTSRVHAGADAAVKTVTAVKPKPVIVKNSVMASNSTLLKLR
jgi:hypothetical protein